MAAELIYLDATGKTVTCTVSQGGASSSPTVSESSGVYTADFASATPGYVYILWENTTDATTHRESLYWDGTAFDPTGLTAQQARDAMDTATTGGKPSLDVQVNNLAILGRR